MAHISFNTQPPEGGWLFLIGLFLFQCCFNTQPPEGGWLGLDESLSCLLLVSTHSRLKAAGIRGRWIRLLWLVSTHSRLKAAGAPVAKAESPYSVSTHSRLKAAGFACVAEAAAGVFQHTAA